MSKGFYVCLDDISKELNPSFLLKIITKLFLTIGFLDTIVIVITIFDFIFSNKTSLNILFFFTLEVVLLVIIMIILSFLQRPTQNLYNHYDRSVNTVRNKIKKYYKNERLFEKDLQEFLKPSKMISDSEIFKSIISPLITAVATLVLNKIFSINWKNFDFEKLYKNAIFVVLLLLIFGIVLVAMYVSSPEFDRKVDARMILKMLDDQKKINDLSLLDKK